MKKLILTAFEPFGGEKINPSAQAAERLPRRIGELEIATLILPVVFGKSAEKLRAAMDEIRPDAVFSIGQAGGRAELTPERLAVNLMDAPIPDNEKNQPHDVPVCADGPAAYFSTLPVSAMADAIRGEGLPVRLSNTAGLYVCNAVMYAALHHAARTLPRCLCGFMHVPYSPRQAAAQSTPQPSMAIDDAARGIAAAVNAIDAFLKDR